nr:uncharacterized protein LOC110125077 [Odocoileus virginianus texanus]
MQSEGFIIYTKGWCIQPPVFLKGRKDDAIQKPLKKEIGGLKARTPSQVLMLWLQIMSWGLAAPGVLVGTQTDAVAHQFSNLTANKPSGHLLNIQLPCLPIRSIISDCQRAGHTRQHLVNLPRRFHCAARAANDWAGPALLRGGLLLLV